VTFARALTHILESITLLARDLRIRENGCAISAIENVLRGVLLPMTIKSFVDLTFWDINTPNSMMKFRFSNTINH
jgi:hypothetical protein